MKSTENSEESPAYILHSAVLQVIIMLKGCDRTAENLHPSNAVLHVQISAANADMKGFAIHQLMQHWNGDANLRSLSDP